MKITTLFCICSLTMSLAAQDCPVQVTDVFKNAETRAGSRVQVYFTNNSDKELSRTSFAVTTLDSAGEVHPLMASFDSGKHVKGGGKKNEWWWIGHDVLDPFTRVKFHAWVQSVQFADGTTWKDDGNHSCVWTKN